MALSVCWMLWSPSSVVSKGTRQVGGTVESCHGWLKRQECNHDDGYREKITRASSSRPPVPRLTDEDPEVPLQVVPTVA